MAEIDRTSPIAPVLPARKRRQDEKETAAVEERRARERRKQQEGDTGDGHRVDEYA